MPKLVSGLLFLTLCTAAGCNAGSAGPQPPGPLDPPPAPPADLATDDPRGGLDMRAPDGTADAGLALPSGPPEVVFTGLGGEVRAFAAALNRADRAELVIATANSVEVLRETPAGWQKTAIESGIQPLRGVHLTLKGEKPWLTYLTLAAGSYDLRVAHEEGAGFVLETVASSTRLGNDAGAPIALNRAGEPVVFYRSGDYAVFSRRGAMSWEAGGIFLQDGYPHSLRRGPSGLLQLTYHVNGTFVSGPRLGLETADGTWLILTPSSATSSGTMDLAIGAADIAHIAQLERTTSQVRFAHNPRRSTGWPTDALEQTAAGDVRVGLVRGPRGEELPLVAYQKLPEADVKIGRRIDGAWHMETVDASGEVGQALALASDSRGRAHIFYIDATTRTLKRVIR